MEMNTYHFKRKEILIVDDDEFSIFLCETLFREHFNITGVTSGHEALKVIEERKFDAVLMDINLGDGSLDGIRTTRLIRQNKKHRGLKIVAITAFSKDKGFYTSQGFDDLFVKPLLEENLIGVMNEALEKRSLTY
ncbi:MAG: response regulator [Bacteroidia bacterium]